MDVRTIPVPVAILESHALVASQDSAGLAQRLFTVRRHHQFEHPLAPDRIAETPGYQRLRDRLVRPVGRSGAERNRRSLMRASATSCARHAGKGNVANRREGLGIRVVYLRIDLVLGTEGRLHHAHAGAVRVRPRRSARRRAAVDILDRARRSDPADCLPYWRRLISLGPSTPSRRSDPQRKIHRRARPPSAPARGCLVPLPGGPVAPDRRRLCRQNFCSAASACFRTRRLSRGFIFRHGTAAQRVRGDPVR